MPTVNNTVLYTVKCVKKIDLMTCSYHNKKKMGEMEAVLRTNFIFRKLDVNISLSQGLADILHLCALRGKM